VITIQSLMINTNQFYLLRLDLKSIYLLKAEELGELVSKKWSIMLERHSITEKATIFRSLIYNKYQ